MKKTRILFASCLGLLALAGCKPTEANYRQAYETAMQRRQEQLQGIPVEGALVDDSDFNPVRIGTDTLWRARFGLRMADTTQRRPYTRYAAGVAQFKMKANAEAVSRDLRANGFPDATVGTSSSDRWVSLIGVFETDSAAQAAALAFPRKLPGFHHVGLPGPALYRIFP